MSFLTIKIDGTERDIIEDFVFGNSLNGNPVIDINPSDVDSSYLEIGNEIQIYNGATKLLSGTIKDSTEILFRGINTKSSRIHVRNLKDKIFSSDLSGYTAMTNLQALTYICADANVTLSTSVTTTNKYAMDKTLISRSFWSIIQDICISEGWGCYVSDDTLYVIDILNDSSSYTMTNTEQLEHEYNDLKVYGNVIINGIPNKERLLSDDNPYSAVIDYTSITSVDSYSITNDNSSDLFSIMSASSDIDNFIQISANEFSFTMVNATAISDTFDNSTSELINNSSNILLLSYENIPYSLSDQVCEQCESVKITAAIPDIGSEITLSFNLTGKKISSYTSDGTPDQFLTIYQDTDANEISKSRFLYYENKNIINKTQLENIALSIARETSNRVLKLKVKIKSDHVFNLLDRIFIDNIGDNFNGYWSVYGFNCRVSSSQQEWTLELVRSNTIIIPELNIYGKNIILDILKEKNNNLFRGIIVNVSENTCFIPALKKTVTFNKNIAYDFSLNDNVMLSKGKEWFVSDFLSDELTSNAEKINFYNGASDDIKGYNGGYNTTLASNWATATTDRGERSYHYDVSAPDTQFTISSVTSINIVGGIFSITVTANKDFDPTSINLNSFVIAPN